MSVSMNVMLAVHGKRADPVDLVGPIKQYVTQTFSDREASDAADDLQAVQQMRDDIVAASNSMEARVELLPKYYAALCVMEVRFPISKEKGHINKVSFSWHDAFKPTKRVALPNIHLEKAAIVFNLATVHSHIALGADRTSADGLKIAAKNFQLSAGAFAFLREHLAMKLPAGTSPDLSTECAAMMERLMLAQAQECVFEKALADKKSAGVCAKLAAQIGLYYEEAHAMVSLPPLDAYMDKVWTTHLQLKAAQFHAEALLRMAMSHREQEDVAPEIARLTAASQILQAAKKKARGQGSPPLMDAVDKLEAAVTRGLDVAHRENNSIYLVRIPSNDALPPLGATSLVKSAPIGEELAARAKESRLFCKLVPDTSAKALSKYTEMVDDAIRLELEAMQKESDEARLCLKQWDLPDMLLALDKVPPGGRAALPEPLFKEVEHMSALGGVVALREIWAQIVDLRSVNEEMLESAVKLLDDEEKDDDNMRQQFKERWNRPKSAELTKNLRDKAKSFRDNMRVAAESDASLQRKMAENGDAFGRLSRPEELSPPRLSKPMVSLAGNEDAIAVGLQHLLVELDKLSKERAGLEEALQEMKQKDNILPRLMSTSESYDALFQQELKKYEPLRSEVSRNISSAQALLRQIEAQQEAFVRTYQVAEWKGTQRGQYCAGRRGEGSTCQQYCAGRRGEGSTCPQYCEGTRMDDCACAATSALQRVRISPRASHAGMRLTRQPGSRSPDPRGCMHPQGLRGFDVIAWRVGSVVARRVGSYLECGPAWQCAV
eukprot:jgi/Mesvir1/24938/Mv16914-RA.2